VDRIGGSWHSYGHDYHPDFGGRIGRWLVIQSRWALWLSLGIGGGVAVAIAATGHGLGDTPIPFLVVMCTLVLVGGQGLRSQVVPPIS